MPNLQKNLEYYLIKEEFDQKWKKHTILSRNQQKFMCSMDDCKATINIYYGGKEVIMKGCGQHSHPPIGTRILQFVPNNGLNYFLRALYKSREKTGTKVQECSFRKYFTPLQ